MSIEIDNVQLYVSELFFMINDFKININDFIHLRFTVKICTGGKFKNEGK